ncbi:MAG: hypothetical protein V1790_09645 [Planctomycetota bacterium]
MAKHLRPNDSFDEFCATLLEEAKRFLEKADETSDRTGSTAFCHAALNLGICAFEAHVNAVAEEFLPRPELNILEKSILSEADIDLEHGSFKLSSRPRYFRTLERYEFLWHRFSNRKLNRNVAWWSRLREAFGLRDALTHPRTPATVDSEVARRSVQALIDALDALFVAIYRRRCPGAKRGLRSVFTF